MILQYLLAGWLSLRASTDGLRWHAIGSAWLAGSAFLRRRWSGLGRKLRGVLGAPRILSETCGYGKDGVMTG